jgi:hypothetical protein
MGPPKEKSLIPKNKEFLCVSLIQEHTTLLFQQLSAQLIVHCTWDHN